MNWIEIIATLCGLISVILIVRENIWSWPVGLVQVVLFAYIFYDVQLYSDFILHLIYIGLQFYGWYHWWWGGNNAEARNNLAISLLNQQQAWRWLALTLATTPMLGFVMSRLTDASFAYADAFTTVASLIATWLMARKKLECWAFWIAVDVVAIPIYYQKGLILTAILYAVFLGLAITGLWSWYQSYRSQESLNESIAP